MARKNTVVSQEIEEQILAEPETVVEIELLEVPEEEEHICTAQVWFTSITPVISGHEQYGFLSYVKNLSLPTASLQFGISIS